MRKRRLLSLLLCCVMACALAVTPSQAAGFTDISGHPAETIIKRWANNYKLITGYTDGTFKPDGSITRAEMATMLNNIFQYDTAASNTFTDVTAGAWYEDAILKLNNAGILTGYGDGQMKPTANITWQEAVVMIARAFGITESADLVTAESDFAAKYTDAGTLGAWALPLASTMSQKNYIELPGSTYDTLFNPAVAITRAEVLTVLDNVIQDMGWAVTGRLYVTTGIFVDVNPSLALSAYNKSEFTSGSGNWVYYNGSAYNAKNGIDVSSHQGTIDWSAVASSGVQFAMIRLGYRGYGSAGTMNMDPNFETNFKGALDAGLDVGVYFYSSAISTAEAQEEAQYVIDELNVMAGQGYRPTYPVAFDWETVNKSTSRTQKYTTEGITSYVQTFCSAIEGAGYQTMFYGDSYRTLAKYDMATLDSLPLWLARYESAPTYYYDYQMWQYTSSGTVSGITGKVDMNLYFLPLT